VERRHLPRPAAAYAARITVAEKQSPGSRRGLEEVAPLSRLLLGQAREPGAGRGCAAIAANTRTGSYARGLEEFRRCRLILGQP
jgi:hypothetical protein